jgi:hypothetical protein
MRVVAPNLRPWLPLVAGVVLGLSSFWASTTFAALLPGLELTSIADGQIVSGTVTLSASADAPGLASVEFQVSGVDVAPAVTSGACSVPWDTRTAGDGVRTVVAIGRDSQGVAVSSTPILVTVLNTSTDLAAPTVSVTSPANGATVSGNVSLTAAASDNTGVVGVWFSVDGINLGSEDTLAPYGASWSTQSVANGAHVVTATARDSGGNTATSGPVVVTVSNANNDSIAPTVAITSPSGGSTVGGTITLSASASDNIGVAGVQWLLDGAAFGAEMTSSPYAVSWNTTTAANGGHTLRAVARDNAGNRTTSAAVSVTVSNVPDSTSPTVSLSSPADGATVSNVITVSASASDNVGVAGVRFTIDGATIGTEDTTSPYSISWNTGTVASGAHTLRAVARDAAGNTRTSTSRTITVANLQDTTPPSVNIAAPSADAAVSGAVLVTASASDNAGILGVQFLLDNANLGAEVMSAPYQVSWPSNLVLNGAHTLTARARDAAGNTRTSASITVNVSNIGSSVPGDFNNDGRPDIIFEHDSGQLYAWYMNGNALIGEGGFVPGGVQSVWRVVGVDDFNGDQRPDLLWQHAVTGQLYIWLMDRTTLIGDLRPPSAAPDWRVAGTGDFNGDGKPDIVWLNRATAQIYVWFMDNGRMIGGDFVDFHNVSLNWRIAGVADFNGDGRVDLLWQDTVQGSVFVTFLNGTRVSSVAALTPAAVSPTWVVRGVADYDGDGNPDLVWQNLTTGELYVWYMNGTALSREGYLTPSQVATSWQVVGGR